MIYSGGSKMKYFVLLLCSISLSISAKDFKVKFSPIIYSDISEDIQGITQSKDYWFISNQYNIYQIPRTRTLSSKNFNPVALKRYRKLKIPDYLRKLRYNHFGGISIYKDYLIVALERIRPLKILFFNQHSLKLERVFDVPMNLESLSWVASDDQLIYFSENKTNKKHPLYIYNPKTNEIKKSIKTKL